METRANHLLIGGAALVFLGALAAFCVWLAQVSFQETQTYRIYFTESVAGLATGASVDLNGIEVGKVAEISLDPKHPKRVIVTVEIDSDVPIHADSKASIQSQGFTGQSYVGISGGSAEAPVLKAKDDQPPVIPSEPSAIAQLMESGPEIAKRAREVVDRAAKLLDEAQRQNIRATIADIKDVTGQLAQHDEEIGRMVKNAAATAQAMDRAADKLNQVLDRTGRTVQDAHQLIRGDLQQLVSQAEALTAEMQRFVAENRQPVREMTTDGFIEARHLINEARILVEDLSQVAEILQENPNALLFGNGGNRFQPDTRQ